MATIAQTLQSIELTETAKASASAAGTNLPNLLANARAHVTELNALFVEMLRLHPATGDDAANYAALVAARRNFII